MSTADDLRAHAKTLPEVEEGTHFRLPAFRVRGSVFAVLQADDYAVLHVDAETADATAAPPTVEKTYRGTTLVGLRVHLPDVSAAELQRIITAAWRHRTQEPPRGSRVR